MRSVVFNLPFKARSHDRQKCAVGLVPDTGGHSLRLMLVDLKSLSRRKGDKLEFLSVPFLRIIAYICKYCEPEEDGRR
jgi:hypothetical protein